MKRKKQGFTLVEMVITILVIIILSTIAVPRYKNYTLSAKRAEGYALLGAIKDAQKQYKSEYGNFLYKRTYTSYDEVLGIDARANKYFTSFSVGATAGAYYFLSYAKSKEAGEITLMFNLSATPGIRFN